MYFILDPFDCGAQIGCGGDGWLISDSNLSPYVINATCSDTLATRFTSLSAINCQCPAISIVPCTCVPTTGSNTTLTISCASQSLSDSAMAAIVNEIPVTTPVDTIDLSGNQLSKVPSGLPQYQQLVSVNISSNAITTVNSGDLTVDGSVTNLDMSSNVITTISSNSLPGKRL